MDTPLPLLATVASLLLAAWAGVHLVTGRPSSRALRTAVLGLAGLFIVVGVVGLVGVFDTARPIARVQLAAYLVLSPAIPAAAWWWARGDRSRTGSAVLLIACLTMAVLVARMTTLWNGPSG